MTTQWGDGHDDRREHVIEDISYARDFIDCRCGAHLTDIADGSTWREHGGMVLELTGSLRNLPPATAEHIEAIRRMVEEREVQDAS